MSCASVAAGMGLVFTAAALERQPSSQTRQRNVQWLLALALQSTHVSSAKFQNNNQKKPFNTSTTKPSEDLSTSMTRGSVLGKLPKTTIPVGSQDLKSQLNSRVYCIDLLCLPSLGGLSGLCHSTFFIKVSLSKGDQT